MDKEHITQIPYMGEPEVEVSDTRACLSLEQSDKLAPDTEEIAIKNETLAIIYEIFSPDEVDILMGNATEEEVAEERGIQTKTIRECISRKKQILNRRLEK